MIKFKASRENFYRLSVIWLTVFALIFSIAAAFPTAANAYEEKAGTVCNVSSYSTLTVREGPGTSYGQIGTLKANDTVTIIDEAAAADGVIWYVIKFDSDNVHEGYVHSDYIKLDGEADPVDPGNIITPENWEKTLELFPESYRESLSALHEKYPTWVFKAMNVSYTWDTSIAEENALGKSLVENSFPSSWKSTQPGAYDWEKNEWVIFDSGRWVAASESIIRYYMDPRNFLDETNVFQFLDQSFDEAVQNVAGIETILKGSFMEGVMPDETDSGLTYAQCIYDASKEYGANPYVIASMLLTEQGRNGSALSDGTYAGYEGYYNFFNYSAYGSSAAETIQRGLNFAKSRGWDTRKKSIYGGTQLYASGYINAGQSTLYLKRFNVQGQNAFSHQYMTSVYGPKSEGSTLSGAYTAEMRTTALTFLIPVYSGMPDTPCAKPTGDGSPNMKLKSLSVSGYTLTPEFATDTLEYSIIANDNDTGVTVTAEAFDTKATVAGAGAVTLSGRVTTADIKVTAENGEVRTYKLTIARNNVEENEAEPQFSDKYATNGIYVVLPPDVTAETVKAGLLTRGKAIITLSDASSKEPSSVMCTGDKILVYDDEDELYGVYTAAVKGDVTGDGAVSGTDFIKMRNHILKTALLGETAAKAADVDLNGTVSGADFIKVRNHILKTTLLS